MFDKLAVSDAHDVGHYPVGRLAMAGKSAVQHDVVAVGDDKLMLVAQFWGQRLDEAEQAGATGCDVGAVLDVVR